MDQQQKRPREDAAPASAPKRKKHSFPLFLGGVQPYWYKDNRDRAEGAAAAYLRDRTNHDDVTVELDVPPYGAGRPKGTAWFRGDGDAPLRAARRAIGKYDAIDPRSRNHTKTVMFKEVKEHNGFADAEQGLMDEICAEAEAKAAAAAPAPAAAPPPPAAAPPRPATVPPTPAAPVTAFVTWRPGPEALWKRALPSVVVAYGGPVIHNTIDAARAQLKGDKDGRRRHEPPLRRACLRKTGTSTRSSTRGGPAGPTLTSSSRERTASTRPSTATRSRSASFPRRATRWWPPPATDRWRSR